MDLEQTAIEDVLHWALEDGVLPGQITFDGMEDTL